MVNLVLKREIQTKDSTFGGLYLDGTRLYWTCEDLQREEKIAGKTAIPCGRYKVVITFSNRFQKHLPLLLDVPNFSGVRIHAGNTAGDTEGCVLLGPRMGKNAILNSRVAMDDFMLRLKEWFAGGEVWLTIEDHV